MPTFGTQPIDQKITIVLALATGSVYFVAVIAMIVASIMYERPGRQESN